MDIRNIYSAFKLSCGVSTDSRTIGLNQMFIALVGDNFDGNQYALTALNKGAKYAVVSYLSADIKAQINVEGEIKCNNITIKIVDSNYNSFVPEHKYIFLVEDTYLVLKELAIYHRDNVLGEGKHLPVIGLTGTNGKTTTKELIYRALSCKYNVVATEGNLNNDIGVPLSILKITQDTQIAIIEMGANHPNDISKLVNICKPDYGLITNVGRAHLLGFKNIDGVIKAKGQLYDYLIENNKIIFYNADDALLVNMLQNRGAKHCVPYGIKHWGLEVLPIDSAMPYVRMTLPLYNLTQDKSVATEVLIESNLVGAYNANNILASISIGLYFKVPLQDIILSISTFAPTNKRSQLIKTNTNTLILDAYNANPSSMKVALDNLQALEDKNKVVLLGSMGELGEDSLQEHISIIQILNTMDLQHICLVGEEFNKAYNTVAINNSKIKLFNNSIGLMEYIKNNPINSSVVLIKGSRSMQMERVVDVL